MLWGPLEKQEVAKEGRKETFPERRVHNHSGASGPQDQQGFAEAQAGWAPASLGRGRLLGEASHWGHGYCRSPHTGGDDLTLRDGTSLTGTLAVASLVPEWRDIELSLKGAESPGGEGIFTGTGWAAGRMPPDSQEAGGRAAHCWAHFTHEGGRGRVGRPEVNPGSPLSHQGQGRPSPASCGAG